MSKKKNNLGRANDAGVPEDEIALAKLLQNACARGYASTRFQLYDVTQDDMSVPTSETTACCVSGAALLEEDTRHLWMNAIVRGNNDDDDDDYAPYFDDQALSCYTIGAAFEQALRPGSAK